MSESERALSSWSTHKGLPTADSACLGGLSTVLFLIYFAFSGGLL